MYITVRDYLINHTVTEDQITIVNMDGKKTKIEVDSEKKCVEKLDSKTLNSYIIGCHHSEHNNVSRTTLRIY